MTMYFWLCWLQAFLLVVAALMIGVAVCEYWRWRKESK